MEKNKKTQLEEKKKASEVESDTGGLLELSDQQFLKFLFYIGV